MWAKLDDALMDHPKFLRVGPLGLALWVSGLLYCARNLSDGFIPANKVPGLIQWTYLEHPGDPEIGHKVVTVSVTSGMSGSDVNSDDVADSLVAAGLWESAADGYWMHDYFHYQPSRKDVMDQRAAAANRKRKSRGNVAVGVTRESRTGHKPPAPAPIEAQTTHRAQPSAVSVPDEAKDWVIQLPTNVKGSFFGVSASDLEGWRSLYPAVDVAGELRKMLGWLDSHPAKRKTSRGMKAFINGWLAREQDRGGTSNGAPAAEKPKETMADMEERWRKEGIL